MGRSSSSINRFFFFPQRGALLATGVSYAILFVLAAISLIGSDVIEKLATTGAGTLDKSALFAALAFALLLLTTYFGISPYYLNWRHTLRAVPGSASAVLVTFSIYWGILQIGLHQQRFVLFSLGDWSFRMTLNNLAMAGLVALLSPVGLRSSFILKGSLPHDFSDFQALARQWKDVLSERLGSDLHLICRSRREGVVDYRFDSSKKDVLPEIMVNMMSALSENPKNPMQPSAKAYAAQLAHDLGKFQTQYQKKTLVSSDSLQRFGEELLESVCSILSYI